MCYNENVKVNISSRGNGWSDNKESEGLLFADGGKTVLKYSFDGDGCILTFKDGVVTQKRSGLQCVNITFQQGKTTLCEFGSGGFKGSFEVFTRSLKFISGQGGIKISLEYLNGSDREPIELTLTAVKNFRGIK